MPCNQGELSSVNFVRSKPFQMIAWIQKQWQQRTTLERACAPLQATSPREQNPLISNMFLFMLLLQQTLLIFSLVIGNRIGNL